MNSSNRFALSMSEGSISCNRHIDQGRRERGETMFHGPHILRSPPGVFGRSNISMVGVVTASIEASGLAEGVSLLLDGMEHECPLG